MIRGKNIEKVRVLGTFLSFSPNEVNSVIDQLQIELDQQQDMRKRGESLLRRFIKARSDSTYKDEAALTIRETLSKYASIADVYVGATDEPILIYIVCDQSRIPVKETNTVWLLTTIADIYPFSLVCVEGAWGVLNVGWLKAFPDRKILQEVSLGYLNRGDFSGEEFYSMVSEHPFLIYGVDNEYLREKLAHELRSKVMLKSCLEKMEEMDERVGILITTNFHKYELLPILRDVQKSYVVLEPRMSPNSLETKYGKGVKFGAGTDEFRQKLRELFDDSEDKAGEKSLDDLFNS
jgi:hypothetical protein